MRRRLTTLAALAATAGAVAPPLAAADPMLADVAYPHPVARFELASQRQNLEMAYMDVAPAPDVANGRAVLLLHGKNFCAAAWESAIGVLAGAGYRVVAPDQVGFCKSSKPERYQYSLSQLAANTQALVAHLGIERPIVVGHSMGGMLAIRYALNHAGGTGGLVLVNPIGLEDWQAKGVPPATVDKLYEKELATTYDTIKAYQLQTYYSGNWRPEYERWPRMLASMYEGPGRETVAWSQALTSDMIFSQPVVHELPRLSVPTVLIIGEKDTTAIGKDRAPPEIKAKLGNYPVLARETADRIPGAELITFPGLGHSPQIEAPAEFERSLLEALRKMGNKS